MINNITGASQVRMPSRARVIFQFYREYPECRECFEKKIRGIRDIQALIRD